jgi:hypothetical protein
MRNVIIFLLSEYILVNIEGFLEYIKVNEVNALTYYYYLPVMWGEYLTITLHVNHIIYVLILTLVLCKYIPKQTS